MELLPQGRISKWFYWREALLLPSWAVMHTPSEAEKTELLKTAGIMDRIRMLVGAPILVHCWIRPVLNNPADKHHGDDYNEWVHGAHNSAHIDGRAVDFSVKGMSGDAVRSLLKPHLSRLGIRMENLPGAVWVHIDTKHVTDDKLRFFKP